MLRRHSRELSVAAALLVLLLILAIFAPGFYQLQPLRSLLTREAPTLIVVCGMALGYAEREAQAAVKRLPAQIGVSDGIKQALKSLS